MRQIHSLLIALCVAPIHLYRWVVSPLLPAACRFEPSCSRYALQAFQAHGLRAGLLLATRRIIRCHPFGASGYDPVPAQYSCHCASDRKE